VSHAEIFTPQYTDRSGPGSTVDYSKPYREFLEHFIREHEIDSIIDFGCGDMEVMGNVDLRRHRADGTFTLVEYFGVDCIVERITRNKLKFPHDSHMRFYCADVQDYPEWLEGWADLLVMKDVLQHWSNDDVARFLARIDFKRALITNCNYGPTVNTDIVTGGWRALDLTKPPFEIGRVVFKWATKDVVLIER